MPQGDPKNPTLGEKVPIFGPVLTASQQVLNTPANTPVEKVERAVGSVPFIGPQFLLEPRLSKGEITPLRLATNQCRYAVY